MTATWPEWQALVTRLAEVSNRFLDEASRLHARKERARFGAWSVEDVLAHLIAWDAEAVRRFRSFLTAPAEEESYDVESFNERAVAARRGATWEALAGEFRSVQQELRNTCAGLRPEDLRRDPRFHGWVKTLADHYEHHLERLRSVGDTER